jgi:hypothetical protein
MLNTKINDNYNANDVINPNDLRKRILNIDSRFRSDLTKYSTEFSFSLEHTYKNIIRLRVSSIEIPNMMYTFTGKNDSFTVKAYDIANIVRVVKIIIPHGNYSSFELITLLQSLFDTELRNAYGIFLNITLNSVNAKVTITHTGVASVPLPTQPVPTQPPKPFVLDFSTQSQKTRKHNFGLGSNLGFSKQCYKVSNSTFSQTGECCLDVVGDTYMFLCINDFHTVEQKTDETYLQCLAKIIIREDRFAVIYDDGSTLMSNEIVFPSPIDLKVLNVKLIDPYGDIVDLNCMNFSFSLEITEVLNTSLYDFYRNYIWLGTIPSIKKASGSQQGLLKGIGP